MSDAGSFRSKRSTMLLSIRRVVVAFLFMAPGAQKRFGVPGAADRKVELMSPMGLAGCPAFFGGGLVLPGLFARPVAFVLSGGMALACFMAHAPRGFRLVLGEAAAFHRFAFLYLSAAGGGAWRLDRMLRQRPA